MSASAEDEARARLEVAQLYEEMGQTDKAVRYLLSAAEILKSGGLVTRSRELYQKILKLEPANQAAQASLNAIMGGAAPPPAAAPAAAAGRPQGPPGAAAAGVPAGPAPTASPTAAAAAVPRPAGQAGVMVPTPLLYRDAAMITGVRSQVTGPPDFALFPYDPLPRVDQAVLSARADARRKAEEVARKKATPRVESAFGGPGGGGFTANTKPASAGFAAAQSSGGSSASKFGAAARQSTAPAAQTPAARPSGDIRGGNRDLADQIAKRLKESDKKPQR